METRTNKLGDQGLSAEKAWDQRDGRTKVKRVAVSLTDKRDIRRHWGILINEKTQGMFGTK